MRVPNVMAVFQCSRGVPARWAPVVCLVLSALADDGQDQAPEGVRDDQGLGDLQKSGS